MSETIAGIRVYDVRGGAKVIPDTLINSYSAMQIPAYKRAMAFISDNLSSFGRSVRVDGAKLTTRHRLDKMLERRPNGTQNATNFWRTLVFHTAHTGNGYAQVTRGREITVDNLLPEDVKPFRAFIEGVLYQFYYHKPTQKILTSDDVLHLQQLSYDGMAGIDTLTTNEITLQSAATLERFQRDYLQKGTVIRGAIELPKDVLLDSEQVGEIKAQIKKYRGISNEEDILVLPDGAKLSNVTTSVRDSQLVEMLTASTKAIAQITGVPPQFLFEYSESKYNNSIEAQGQDAVRYLFRPWIEMIEDELTLKLLTPAEQDNGYRIHIDPDELLRGSTSEQGTYAKMMVDAGIWTQNDAREYVGKPRLNDPEADKLKRSGDTSPPKPTTTGPKPNE
jgi:HK97 family phage portal protein